VNRIEASTEITNIGEQRALERAGFTREGVLRGATFQGGAGTTPSFTACCATR